MAQPSHRQTPSADATLQDALDAARAVWEFGPGWRGMVSGAPKSIEILGPETRVGDLIATDGLRLRQELLRQGLVPSTVINYQRAFQRMLKLNRALPAPWPYIPSATRRGAAAVSPSDRRNLAVWLEAKSWAATADLVHLIAGSGLRVRSEVLAGRFRVDVHDDCPVVEVTDGAKRRIPINDQAARGIIMDPKRLDALCRTSYSGHLQRLRKATMALGVQGGTVSFKGLRESFRQDALVRRDGNPALVADVKG